MTVVKKSALVRPWRGQSPEERVSDRRERLVEAGLDVFATRTFHATKVRDVCRAAGLTERYFYESFAGKEALLSALADRIIADFLADAGPSLARIEDDFEAAIEGAMRAVVLSLTDDPRRARILFVEVVGVSPLIEERRRAVIGSLVGVIVGAAEQAFGGWVRETVEVQLIARSVIGAIAELLVAYVRDELPLDQEELILNLTRVILRARPILVALAAEQRRSLA